MYRNENGRWPTLTCNGALGLTPKRKVKGHKDIILFFQKI